MFELGRKPSQVILVVFLDQKLQKSQRISVPTDQQTLSMHRYLLIESHRRSVGKPLYRDQLGASPVTKVIHLNLNISIPSSLGAHALTLIFFFFFFFSQSLFRQ